MFCAQCGNKMIADAKFCTQCGNPTRANASGVLQSAPHAPPNPEPDSGTNAKPLILLGIAAAITVFVALMIFSFGSTRGPSLVGVWDWEGMTAIVLREDGGYTWMGVDYGLLGSRWSSRNGVVSFTLLGVTSEWFRYEFIDRNTLRIEYAFARGVFYTLRRRGGSGFSDALEIPQAADRGPRDRSADYRCAVSFSSTISKVPSSRRSNA